MGDVPVSDNPLLDAACAVLLPQHCKQASAAIKVVPLTSSRQRAQSSALETKVWKGPTKTSKHHKTFGIYDGRKLVAMTRVTTTPLKAWESDEAYDMMAKFDPEVAITATAVHPDHRGKGLATELKKHLQGRYARIITGSGRKSHPSVVRVNEKTGFEKALQRKSFTIWKWEQPEGR